MTTTRGEKKNIIARKTLVTFWYRIFLHLLLKNKKNKIHLQNYNFGVFHKRVKIKKKKKKRLSPILFHHHMMHSCDVTISETATERNYRIMSTIFGEWKLIIMDKTYADIC
jgi:hypothetical protein